MWGYSPVGQYGCLHLYSLVNPRISTMAGCSAENTTINHQSMEKLHFIETLSIEDFKTQHNVEKIEVKQNPHTGKCFFVYGFETGVVSEKFLKGEISNPVISHVCSPEDGEMFYMLHEKGDGGAPVLATL